MKHFYDNKVDVLEIIYAFQIGGSERLAALIATELKEENINAAVCAIHGYEGPISKQLKNEGVSCYAMGGGLVSSLIVRLRLYKLFLKLKPKVIHAHHVSQLAISYWPARLAGIKKIILTEHANYSITIQPKLKKQATFYSKKVELITTVHDGLGGYFYNELDVKKVKIITIPNGINTSDYSPSQKNYFYHDMLGLLPETLVFVCVGRLVEAKDHFNLLKAVKIMVENGCCTFHLLIVGGGPKHQEIKSFIKKFGLIDYVSLLGERDDIQNILNNSDIFILSSKREGFPMGLLEAMSSGLPCITTNVGAITKIISHEAGIIVDIENSEELADAMIKLYNNREKLSAMGEHSRSLVLKSYDIVDVLRMYKDILIN